MAKRKNKGLAVLARRIKGFKPLEGAKGYKKPGSQNSHKVMSGGRRK